MRGKPKLREGVVVSNRMTKTVVVQIERLVRHAKYGKYLKQRTKFKAHDERGECQVGDAVQLVETRPLSAQKRWRVRAVLKKAV